MLNPGILTFQEFMTQESLPLATLQQAVLEFLQSKDDVVIFGAQAVNAYVIAYHQRRNQPKAGTDWRDLAMLLLQFPQFKETPSLITEQLIANNAPPETLTLWQTLVTQDIQMADEDAEF